MALANPKILLNQFLTVLQFQSWMTFCHPRNCWHFADKMLKKNYNSKTKWIKSTHSYFYNEVCGYCDIYWVELFMLLETKTENVIRARADFYDILDLSLTKQTQTCLVNQHLNFSKPIEKTLCRVFLHLCRHVIIHLITITSYPYQVFFSIDIVYGRLAWARAHTSF